MSVIGAVTGDVSSGFDKYEFDLVEDILDDYIKDEHELKETENEVFEAKCGNIMFSSCGSYSFGCEFCDVRFMDLNLFKDHVEAYHFNNDSKQIIHPGILTTLEIEVGSIDNSYVYDEDGDSSRNYEDNEVPVDGEDVPNTQADVPTVDNSSLTCNLCKREFASKSSLSRHTNNHKHKDRKIKSKSDQIHKPSSKLVSESEGTNDSLSDEQLICDLCSRQFKNIKSFRIHAAKRHGNQIPKSLKSDPTFLKCKYCHEQFELVLERVQHEKTHTEDKPFRCQLCPKSFRVNFQRELHMNSHTGAHPFPCPHCPKSFTSAINRLQHIRGHLGIKRFSCEFCGKKFITNVQKSIHVRIHTHEKPYQCEECGERFRVSGQLFSHRKRHENIRDCECDICGKRFFSNEAVKEHKVRHSNVHPFECAECGRAFKRKKTLVTHLQLHQAEKTYACTICGKKFAQCAGLHSHMKIHGSKFRTA